jgi:hypothetical protein
MAKYQEIIYGSGVVYGEPSRISFSAEPVSAVALSHSTIQVTWATPLNNETTSYVGFRVVRNQDAFPETEEDGVILYEFYTTTSEIVDSTSFIDGEDEIDGFALAPLVSGRFAYYRTWILLDPSGEWVRAGDAYTLLPDPHYSGTGPDTVASQWSAEFDEVADRTIGNQNLTTTHDRMMSFIPRVYLSANQGPLDAIQEYDDTIDDAGPRDNVLLNQFLKGFSLTADEFLNYAEFIAPDISGKNTSPNILQLQSHQLNLSFDTAGISRTQKKMVREALFTYRRKGTLTGLQTAVEAITGYDVTLSPSRNLMLSPQDGTFYQGLGFWNAGTGCTIALVKTVEDGPDVGTPVIADVPNAIDFEYCAAVEVAIADANIYNGFTSPITRGIPVSGSTDYSLSFYANFNDDPGAPAALATPTISWFDRKGNLISRTTGENYATNAEGAWVRVDMAATSPSAAVYAGIGVSFNVVGTWYVDMFQFEESDEVTPFFEARGVDVTLNPKKTNHIADPSFEGDLSVWTFDNGTATAVSLISGGVYDGPRGARSSLKKLIFESEATGDCTISTTVGYPLPWDRFYTFSFYAKADEDVTATITLLDSNEEETSKEIALTDAWQRFFVTHYYKKPTYFSQLTATILGTDWAGATIELDCTQLEESYYPTDFFDGNLTNSGGAWVGTVNESRSVYYPGINTKLTRLANEIEKYMPINTPYRVLYTRNEGGMNPPKGVS